MHIERIDTPHFQFIAKEVSFDQLMKFLKPLIERAKELYGNPYWQELDYIVPVAERYPLVDPSVHSFQITIPGEYINIEAAFRYYCINAHNPYSYSARYRDASLPTDSGFLFNLEFGRLDPETQRFLEEALGTSIPDAA